MSHAIWFNIPLTCPDCGQLINGQETRLHTAGLNPEAIDRWVRPGEVINAYLDDFTDAYLQLNDVSGGNSIQCLEQWRCPICKTTQWARLEFRQEAEDAFRFISATAVVLSADEVTPMHFISRSLPDWLALNPSEENDKVAQIIRTVI